MTWWVIEHDVEGRKSEEKCLWSLLEIVSISIESANSAILVAFPRNCEYFPRKKGHYLCILVCFYGQKKIIRICIIFAKKMLSQCLWILQHGKRLMQKVPWIWYSIALRGLFSIRRKPHNLPLVGDGKLNFLSWIGWWYWRKGWSSVFRMVHFNLPSRKPLINVYWLTETGIIWWLVE